MMDVVADRELGPLDPNKVLVLSISSFQYEPIIPFVAFIFVPLTEVPAKNKVLGDIVNTWTDDAHSDIVPRHSSVFCFGELVCLPVLNIFEIENAIVVVILSRKNLVLHP